MIVLLKGVIASYMLGGKVSCLGNVHVSGCFSLNLLLCDK